MIRKITYNNRVLSAEEREVYCRKADEYINQFSEYIEAEFQLAKEVAISEDSDFVEINKALCDISRFTTYAFCDCIVLDKLFVRATHPYEKSFLRGKLKVQLNESFKKLYGFKNGYKDSYCAKLEQIINRFPGLQGKFDELLFDLEQISQDSWWKEERNAEVHIDAAKLYELRHEEINESKVAMEAMQLIDLLNRINRLLASISEVSLNHVRARFYKEHGYLPAFER